MKRFIILVIVVIIMFSGYRLFFTSFSSKHCGTERWSVKTLTDADTTSINFKDTVKTTVEAQTQLSKPKKVGKNMPRQELECQLVSVDCYIVQYKKEDDDKDFHVVIQDPETGSTMIAEIPSPEECSEIKESGHSKDIAAVRQWFEKNIGVPTDRFTKCKPSVKVRLSGIGFFDFNHGQTGRAPNGREIHPVLKIKFLN
jgi:hypothetical protein